MPIAKRPGRTAISIDIPDDLDAELRAYCAAIGSKVTAEIRLAIKRHLQYPPARETPKLPTDKSGGR